MVRIRVIRKFRDKFDYSHLYQAGEIAEFEAKRAEDIVSRGLGERVPDGADKSDKSDELEAVTPKPKRTRKKKVSDD